jgi:hypothetical protein
VFPAIERVLAQGEVTAKQSAVAGQGARPDAEYHYLRNAGNEQFAIEYNLYGRNDLTLAEIDMAGEFGMKQSSAAETKYHRIGEGNEGNLKFTSKVAWNESWWQRNWSNRYGRYEVIVRPNNDRTYTYVNDPINMGTLNRGNDPISHWVLDVKPYKKYGNTLGDW